MSFWVFVWADELLSAVGVLIFVGGVTSLCAGWGSDELRWSLVGCLRGVCNGKVVVCALSVVIWVMTDIRPREEIWGGAGGGWFCLEVWVCISGLGGSVYVGYMWVHMDFGSW